MNVRILAVSVVAAVLLFPGLATSRTVAVSGANGTSIGSRPTFSSSALVVAWSSDAGETVHHFEVAAIEAVQGTSARVSVDAGLNQVTLTGLKSATQYSVVVTSCADASCSVSTATEAVTASTDTEFWRLAGSGNSVPGLATVVSDSNARLSATRFGPDAGSMANRVQLYYGPRPSFGVGPSLAAAVAAGPADVANPSTYLTFTSRANASGVLSPPAATPLVSEVATGQGVPVRSADGGFVRLFFEAQGADQHVRIVSLDSADGLAGLDFNRGAETTCRTSDDYAVGGGCEPTVAIAIETDAGGNRRIKNARQHKVGWPTLDSALWDQAPGTFMVFTTDVVDGCSMFWINHGYAVWNGTRWEVQYGADGCPRLFRSAQAAFPFHSGGVRYRLYYGDPSITEGKPLNTNVPFLGPKKLIYADGRVSGSPDTVEFDDWEPQEAARQVVFLWPTDEPLDATAAGFIDDYHFLTPTGDPSLQVMYLTITDGASPPRAATATLVNP